ncbi:TBC1 domain family member 30-like isoform x2 [Plakobranchus ocellatus]|uniref:TBC1 domain family member 30-like isoform x2 n=1 Tax=Plakobranchus ocellatus TaxID=259542 RepID=A0AAV3YB23_9GAST|nr:TBC1 domain family member 30-like isoform x2 [Plakobranchus ocellatus]
MAQVPPLSIQPVNDDADADDKLFMPVARSPSNSGLLPLRPPNLNRQGSHESSSSENDQSTSPCGQHRFRASSPRLHFFPQQMGTFPASPATITTSTAETHSNCVVSSSSNSKSRAFFSPPSSTPPSNFMSGIDGDDDVFHFGLRTLEKGNNPGCSRLNPFRPPSPYGELVEQSSPDIDYGESFDEMDIETMSTVNCLHETPAPKPTAVAPHRISLKKQSSLPAVLSASPSTTRVVKTVTFPNDASSLQSSIRNNNINLSLVETDDITTGTDTASAIASDRANTRENFKSPPFSLDHETRSINHSESPEMASKNRRTSIVDGLLHEIYDRYHLHGRSDSVDSDTLTECSSTSEATFFHHGHGMLGGGYHAALLERRHASHLNRSFLQNQSKLLQII